MTNDEQIILNCALRYSLSRKTYITSVVSDFIINKIPDLSQKTISVMIRDIEKTEDLGHECDKKNWLKLLEKLYDKKNSKTKIS